MGNPIKADTKRAKRVSDLLQPGQSGFSRLMAQAKYHDRLDRLLDRILDPGMVGRVRVATLRNRTLLLVTPVAAIATRLRMDSHQLVKSLHDHGVEAVEEISVRVAPLGGSVEKQVVPRELPTAAKEALQRFAEDCGDPEIKALVAGVRKESD